MAISDYAPGCEVVAAGNLIKSRYIKKVANKAWREYDFVRCEKCGTLNIDVHHDAEEMQTLCECKQCGTKFDKNSIKTFIIPEFGFSSDPKITKPSLIKPDRTYRSEASMVTRGNEINHGDYQFGDLHIQTISMEDGEIL